jgi:hypothetical protein
MRKLIYHLLPVHTNRYVVLFSQLGVRCEVDVFAKIAKSDYHSVPSKGSIN